MKLIDNINFKEEKVLVRVDYNVPQNEKLEITDKTRIVRTIDTVKKIANDGGIAILMSHLGRPKGKSNDIFSLKHIVKDVSAVMGQEVIFLGDILDPEIDAKVAQLKLGDIALLENLRFHKEEEEGDVEFAKNIAKIGNLYVNDAFGTAHRSHASTATIVQFFPEKAYAGYLLYNEVVSLKKVLIDKKEPFTAIIGGSKISTKINILNNLIEKVDNLIIGGGMSYTFLKALNIKIGNSICEDEMIPVAKEIIKKALVKKVNFLLPIDNVCADKFSENANTYITTENHIDDDWIGMDIGPETIKKFAGVINQSKTILWNGPIGVFEMDKYGKGTNSIGMAIAGATIAGAYSLIGGGDTIAALEKYHLSEYVSYISTGGGAMLEYLEGIELPGIKALEEN